MATTVNSGIMTVNQTLDTGALTVAAGATLNGGGIAQIDAGGTVVNSGTISNLSGVELNGGTLTNNAGASIQGSLSVPVPAGFFFYGDVTVSTGTVTNAGLISGANGVVFTGGGSLTNQAGGMIEGIAQNDNGFDSNTGAGIYAFIPTNNPVTIVNEAGATIEGVGTDSWGIHTGSAPVNITNYGIISGNVDAINVNGGGTIINEAGGFMTSTLFQPIGVTHGTENIINFGTISSSYGGIGFGPPAGGGTVTNNAGGTISGTGPNSFGIASGATNESITVINSGAISGSSGIDLGTGGGSITNNATGSITGVTNPAVDLASGGTAMIVNSGTISSASGNAIDFEGSAGGSVTNNPGGVLAGGSGSAIISGTGEISITNAGAINGSVNLGNAQNTVTLVSGGNINGNLNLGTDSASTLVLDGSGLQALSQAVTGTITNSGSLTKQGSGTWVIDENLNAPVATAVNSGILTVNQTLDTGALTVAEGATLNGAGRINAGGSLTNSGNILGTNSSYLVSVGGGASVTNNVGASIQSTGASGDGIYAAGNNAITNAGTIAGGSTGIVLGGSTGSITNTGVISGGENGIISGGGSISNNAGATIEATAASGMAINGTTATAAITLSNAGTISGAVNLGNAANIVTLVAGGIIDGNLNLGTNSGSVLVLDGSGQQALSQAVTGSITDAGSLTKQGSGTWVIDENLNVPEATSVNLGILTVNQTLDTGALTVAEGATLNGAGVANINTGGTLTNSGSIVSAGGSRNLISLGAGASLTNNIGASINSLNGAGILAVAASPVDITNFGTIEALDTGIYAISGGSVINSGTISGSSGVILGGGSLINNATGSIAGNGGYGVATDGGVEITNAGTISGQTGIALSLGASSSVANNPGGVIAGTSGVAIDITGGTGAFALWNAGTINGAVNLGSGANTVTLVTGSSINGNLNLGTNSGSTLVLDGSGQQALSQAVTGSITNAGSLTKQGTGTWTIDENLSAPVATTVNSGILTVNQTLDTGALTVAAGATLNGGGSTQITAGGTVVNSGIISDVSGVELAAGGIVTNNTGGSIQSTNVFTGGITALANNATVTNAGSISGSSVGIELYGTGSITNEIGGTIEGTGSNTDGIATGAGPANIINSGTISGSVGVFLGSGGGGSLTNNATGSVVGGSGLASDYGVFVYGGTENIYNAGTISGQTGIALFSGASGSVTNNLGGVITGTSGVAINTTQTTGAVTLSNAGTINGAVNLGNGNAANTVTLVTGGTINGALNLGTNSGSTLIFDGSGQQAVSQAVTGSISNSGSLIKQGAGTWIVDENLSAPVATTVNSGILTVNQTLDTGALTVAAGATLNGVGFTVIDAGGTLTNFGSIISTKAGYLVDLGPGASVTNNVGASIQSTGANGDGIYAAGENAISNSGVIAGGSTGIVLGGSSGSISNSGMISGGESGILSGGGSITNNVGGTIEATGVNGVAINGSASGAAITLSNAGTISGAVNLGNAVNTVTLVSGGVINGNLSLGTNSGSALVLDGSGQQALSQAVTGSITNSGSLIKQGAGTWTIDENLSAPVATSINGGILKVIDTLTTPVLTVNAGGTLGGAGLVTGNVINNGGTVAPGDPQTLSIGGDYTQEAGGNLQIDIASASSYDILLVTGQVSLLAGSVLTLDFIDGFDPVAGDTFDFLQPGGGLTGSFSQVVVDGLTKGLQYLLQSNGSNGYEMVALNGTSSVPDGGRTLTMLLIGVFALISANYVLQASRQKETQTSH